MSWAKVGDNAATYPPLMRLATGPGADDRTLNEATGWLLRCAFQSAGHMTDYVIDEGTAAMLGGPRWRELVKTCTRAGLLNQAKTPTGGRAWRLIEDPEFIHLRLKKEVEFDRKRDRDRKNDDLVLPVLRRDGDACRYCSRVVNPGARTGPRAREFDHRDKDNPTTVDTYVVACRACNGRRTNDPHADDLVPLQPPPPKPYYSAKTLERLVDYFGPTTILATPHATGHRDPARPNTATAHRDPATPNPRDARPTRPDTAPHRDPAPPNPREARPAALDPASSAIPAESVGPGGGTRVGSGRDGPGLGASPNPPRPKAPDPPARRRARRGRGGHTG